MLSIEMYVRITENAGCIFQQGFFFSPDTIHLKRCQFSPGKEITFRTGIGQTFRIGKERRTQRTEFGKHNFGSVLYK